MRFLKRMLGVTTLTRMTIYLIFVIFLHSHIFSLKILNSKVRKFATKIASRQNSVNQYWEVKFTFIFLAATFDHEIMKRKGRLALPPWASWSPLSQPCWQSLRSATYKSNICININTDNLFCYCPPLLHSVVVSDDWRHAMKQACNTHKLDHWLFILQI